VTVLVGNALVVLTAVLAWAFCVLYHFLAPWWRSTMGRNVMTYGLVVAAVLSLSVVRLAFGAAVDTPWFSVLRLVVFAGVPLAIGWRIAILVRLQIRNPKGRR
jgi:hypothetical protein